MGGIIDFFRLVLPLSNDDRERLDSFSKILDDSEIFILSTLLKKKEAGFSYRSLGVSASLIENSDLSNIYLNDIVDPEKLIKKKVEEINQKINNFETEKIFNRFSVKADKVIPKFISSNITGMDAIKEAVSLQLFSNDRVHILMLGDPGTGKTDVLRSASDLSPISSFGLGSGTSNAGLSLSVKGNEIFRGLLPMADKGLCCIDELNLMKNTDMASLYSAMEKGFVSYDKSSKHIKEDARVKILATANPKGDKFVGWILSTLKKQIPFDSALLSRFHLVFLVRKPDLKEFGLIAKKIIGEKGKKENPNDVKFIKDYIKFTENLDVKIPKEFEQIIIDFAKDLKEREKDFIVEISPRIVHGLISFAKASARMNMRNNVMSSDLAKVKNIFETSLKIKK